LSKTRLKYNLIGLNILLKSAFSIHKEAMASTDCEILSESIPVLDSVNCCDHAAIICSENENGEMRVKQIIDKTKQLKGY
jgi:hypothetical protein